MDKAKSMQRNCQIYQQLHKKKNIRIALIISPKEDEQKTLSLMLKNQGYQIYQAYTKKELLEYFSYKRRYDVVIVSEQITEIGLNFFRYFFRNPMRKQQTFLIYLAENAAETKILGFHGHLKHQFLLKDLLTLLPKHKLKGVHREC